MERNLAATVDLQVTQSGQPTIIVGQSAGPVLITANVADPNSGDQQTYDWSMTASALVDMDTASGTFTFDPSGLAPGVYKIGVLVTDNGNPPLSVSASVYLRVVASLPSLGANDTDGDGIDDQTEGSGDSDGDGVPNYLDAIAASNVLPEQAAQTKEYLVECDPSAQCRLGENAIYADSGGVQLITNQIAGLTMPAPDTDYDNVGGIFDFEAVLPVVGDSLQVVIPQRQVIPAAAVYRKYTTAAGWSDFVQDANNLLYSTPGEPGFCPPPGDARWEVGLKAGYWCVQMRIADGGPNDADHSANGVVVDPGGVGAPASVNYVTTGGGGGAIGVPTLLSLLMFGGLRRRRSLHLKQAMLGVLSCLVLTVPMRAQAQQDDWLNKLYVSGEVGHADTNVGSRDVQDDFTAHGIATTVTSVDGSRDAWGIGAGYRINAHWAVEAAYLDLGEVEVQFTAPSTATNLADVHPESGNGVTASGLYQYPLNAQFSLRARLGVFAWHSDYKTRRANNQIDTSSDSAIDPYWGFGAAYQLAPRWRERGSSAL